MSDILEAASDVIRKAADYHERDLAGQSGKGSAYEAGFIKGMLHAKFYLDEFIKLNKDEITVDDYIIEPGGIGHFADEPALIQDKEQR